MLRRNFCAGLFYVASCRKLHILSRSKQADNIFNETYEFQLEPLMSKEEDRLWGSFTNWISSIFHFSERQ